MTLPSTPAQARRALLELPPHPFEATAQATRLIGQEGVQKAVAEIGVLLLRADVFNPRWVAVAYWDHGGQQLQAISRFWPNDGSEYRTEVSLTRECYGGFAAALAQTALETWPPEQLRTASRNEGHNHVPAPDGEEARMIAHGPYRIVCVPAPIVLEGESKLQEEPNHE